MRIVNENRRMAHYFHLNIQAHPHTIRFMKVFLNTDYTNTFDNREFDRILDEHLATHKSSINEILEQVFGNSP